MLYIECCDSYNEATSAKICIKMRILQLLTLLTVFVCVFGKTSDGYVIYKTANKGYKLIYQADVWTKAEARCRSEGALLAVPKNEDEFLFIQKMVRGMYLPNITGSSFRLLVWLGINNLDDYRVWKSVDGDNIRNGFHKWSGENGIGFSDSLDEPHCAGIDAINPGLRDWWCHRRQPYICEKKIEL